MSKIKKWVHNICQVLEMIAAGLVSIGILLALISVASNLSVFRDILKDPAMFKEYLDTIFTLVIGIEFLEMLCRPNSENVLEVLIFLVARHMIAGSTTKAINVVSTCSGKHCLFQMSIRSKSEPGNCTLINLWNSATV